MTLNKVYAPYGSKWEKEMMRFTKIELIRLLKKSRKENSKINQALKSFQVPGL